MPGSSSTQTAPLPTFTAFGDLLKFLRRRARMTQTELSIAVGYSISQISRLEQNERFPDEASLLAVFVPALGLEKEPETIARLLALAKIARGEAKGAAASGRAPLGELPHAEPAPADSPLLTNLPPRLTSFIGRADEIVALRQCLAVSRLVTLTGAGGVGKTSLALETARLAPLPDGVWLVELAALQEATFVPQLLMDTFKLPEVPGRLPLDALTTYLQHKQLRLLLDNCEHLIATCAELVTRLLRSCPHLSILATSREALNVDGEVEWLVPPLRTPEWPTDASAKLAANTIVDYAAVNLFLARARAMKPDFALTDQNAPAIVQICVQLDGMPLAIELAAARLKGLTVEQIAARLHDRFTLLTSGRRTALLRQQTLRAAIDWSYDLLTEPEKTLLRQLAVFTGGWTLEAAEAVARDRQTNHQTLTLLLQLVNKSLVVADERGGEIRYHLLETIRQYAAEKLWEAGEERGAHERHFAYFLALAEQSHDPTLIGRRLSSWFNHMVLEHGNLRSAVVWGRERADDGEGQLRLAGALGLFWISRAGYDEGIEWLEEALAQGSSASAVSRAIALSRLADLLTRVGRYKPDLIEAARVLFTQSNYKEGLAYCLVLKAQTMVIDPSTRTQAISYHKQALALFRESGHVLFTGYMLCHVADALYLSSQPVQAIALYEECLALGQKYEEFLLVGRALDGLSTVNRPRALALCRDELARQRTQGDQAALAVILEMFGRLLQDADHDEEALPVLVESLAVWRKLGIKWSDRGGIARATLDLGHTYFWLGDYLPAARYIKAALQLYTEVGDIHGVAWTQMMLGYIALRQNETQQAIAYFRASLQHSTDHLMNYLPLALCGLAQAKHAQGDPIFVHRVFGAAAYHGDKLFPVDAAGEAPFLKLLAAARPQFTDPVLAAARAEGQAMTIEQAVAYALAPTRADQDDLS